MSKSTSTSDTFLQVNYRILSSTILSSTQKLIISYILGWQSKGKICFESNPSLAARFGIKLKTFKNIITELNKFPFFNSIKTSMHNENGTWSNSKKIVIDEVGLNDFLKNEITTSEETIQEEKEVIQPEPSVSKQVLLQPSKIETNKPLYNKNQNSSINDFYETLIEKATKRLTPNIALSIIEKSNNWFYEQSEQLTVTDIRSKIELIKTSFN